jgi:hypothetical protein
VLQAAGERPEAIARAVISGPNPRAVAAVAKL